MWHVYVSGVMPNVKSPKKAFTTAINLHGIFIMTLLVSQIYGVFKHLLMLYVFKYFLNYTAYTLTLPVTLGFIYFYPFGLMLPT